MFGNEQLFAFNIWDINSAKAVLDAALTLEKDVILQTSASIYKQIPQKQLREFITSYLQGKRLKAWLHLDHCRDVSLIEDAVENGWDIVMIDASDQSLEENIRLTNQVARYAHGKSVLVEAEVGQVRGTEENIKTINEQIATKGEIARFIERTDIDLIAVAFGNAHGMYQGEPELHYDLIEYTARLTSKPFVVHGGSGLTDDVLKRLLQMKNVRKINFSTDVKLAYRRGIQRALEDGRMKEEGFQAIGVEKDIHDEIVKMIEHKLLLLDEMWE